MKTRTFFAFAIVLILLTVFVSSVMAMAPGGRGPDELPPDPTPPAVLLLIPALLGGIGIPLINRLKAWLDFTKPEDNIKNSWLSFGVSVFLAVIALLITGSFVPMTGPETIVSWVTVAFTTATLIYKSIRKSESTQ
jgi:hypothetical protein